MRFLDTLDLYLTEGKDPYNLYPLDYDADDGSSFGVDIDGSDDSVAKIIIKTIDGAPVDALGGSYDYDDVYADVEIQGDTDDPKNLDLVSWLVNKLIKLGYDENTIRIDGKVYYENDEDKNALDLDDTDEVEPSDEFDPSDDPSVDLGDGNYWAPDDDAERDIDSGKDSIPSTVDADEPFDTDRFDIDDKLSHPERTNRQYKRDGELNNDDTVDDSETEDYDGNFPKGEKKKLHKGKK